MAPISRRTPRGRLSKCLLANLRKAGVLNIEGIRNLSVEQLRELIRPSGFYTRKAPALKAFVAMLDAEFGGSLDRLAAAPTAVLRSRLLALPGVGPETADAILLYALNHPVPVADEYLRRIATRHGLINPAPEKNRKGYESLVQLTRDAFASDPTLESRAALQRVPRVDGCRGQGTLRKDSGLRALSPCRRSARIKRNG